MTTKPKLIVVVGATGRQGSTTCNDKNPEVQCSAIETTGNILSLLPCMSHFDEVTIKELSLFIDQFKSKLMNNVSPKKFVNAFLDTKISCWLPVIKHILVLQSNAAIVINGTITLYGDNEPIELSVGDVELERELKDALVNWREESS